MGVGRVAEVDNNGLSTWGVGSLSVVSFQGYLMRVFQNNAGNLFVSSCRRIYEKSGQVWSGVF